MLRNSDPRYFADFKMFQQQLRELASERIKHIVGYLFGSFELGSGEQVSKNRLLPPFMKAQQKVLDQAFKEKDFTLIAKIASACSANPDYEFCRMELIVVNDIISRLLYKGNTEPTTLKREPEDTEKPELERKIDLLKQRIIKIEDADIKKCLVDILTTLKGCADIVKARGDDKDKSSVIVFETVLGTLNEEINAPQEASSSKEPEAVLETKEEVKDSKEPQREAKASSSGKVPEVALAPEEAAPREESSSSTSGKDEAQAALERANPEIAIAGEQAVLSHNGEA